jgi:25S rRNA (uracil2634-N3)-methyltransferase
MGNNPKSRGLQAALAHQQSRLQKQKQAAKASEKKEKASKKIKRNIRPTIPFNPTDKILLIGEGNFSFAYALVVHPPLPDLQHLPPENVFATAYDTQEECLEKYPEARQTIQVLREKGVHVLFGVDATKLEKCAALKGRTFDKVVWNFPHAGDLVLNFHTAFC